MAVVISDGGENMKHVSLLGKKEAPRKKRLSGGERKKEGAQVLGYLLLGKKECFKCGLKKKDRKTRDKDGT